MRLAGDYCEFLLKWPSFLWFFVLKKRPFQHKLAVELEVFSFYRGMTTFY